MLCESLQHRNRSENQYSHYLTLIPNINLVFLCMPCFYKILSAIKAHDNLQEMHSHIEKRLESVETALARIKTHDSESRGQEEAGRTRRMSLLFTGSTAVKFVNTLNKPPLKLSLSYQRFSTF